MRIGPRFGGGFFMPGNTPRQPSPGRLSRGLPTPAPPAPESGRAEGGAFSPINPLWCPYGSLGLISLMQSQHLR